MEVSEETVNISEKIVKIVKTSWKKIKMADNQNGDSRRRKKKKKPKIREERKTRDF